MVAPDAWGGELVENILSLMEGHQTHTEEGEAEAQNRSERLEMKRELSASASGSRLHLQTCRTSEGLTM